MAELSHINRLGKEVPIGSIEQELRQLWAVDDARTNASLINFAVYSEDASSLEENSDRVREITQEHACRALLIGIDRESEKKSIRAWITAHCHLSHGKKSICCEQLSFHLTGSVSGRFRNTVFAHLNSDLPLVFWWQGEISDRFNERLYSLIQRFIVDSSQWRDLAGQFNKLRPAIEHDSIVVQDLAWMRTHQMRLSIAGLYDDPIAQASIEGIQQVKIVTSPEHRVSGLMLLAWLAVQSGWRQSVDLFEGDAHKGAYRFEHQHGGVVDVQLLTEQGSAPVSLVELSSESVTVKVSRESHQSLLLQQLVADGHKLEQCAPADSLELVDLVRSQLSRGGKNALFTKILPTFYQLL